MGEYSLNSHGSAGSDDDFDYNSFTDWFVHQCDLSSVGSIVWNFDSFYSAWGPVNHPRIGNSIVKWKNIWAQPSDSSAFHCASCSPPQPQPGRPFNSIVMATTTPVVTTAATCHDDGSFCCMV